MNTHEATTTTDKKQISGGLFVIGTALMLFATQMVIPLLTDFGIEPVVAWFIAAAGFVLKPLIWLAWRSLSLEERADWRNRLRLSKPSSQILKQSAIGVVVVGASAWLLSLGLEALNIPITPDYLSVDPLTLDRWWILALWIPFFVINIAGEEFVWRGVVLPRQQAGWQQRTWWVHGAGWAMFHIPMGLGVTLATLPFFVVIPWLAVRTSSSWPGLLIHGLINGPAFLAVLFGLVQ